MADSSGVAGDGPRPSSVGLLPVKLSLELLGSNSNYGGAGSEPIRSSRKAAGGQCDGKCTFVKELEVKNQQLSDRISAMHERLKRLVKIESSILDLHIEVQERYSDVSLYGQLAQLERQRHEAQERCKGDPLVLIEMLRANIRVQFMAREAFEKDLRYLIEKSQSLEQGRILGLEMKLREADFQKQVLENQREEAVRQADEVRRQKDAIARSSGSMIDDTNDLVEQLRASVSQSKAEVAAIEVKMRQQEETLKQREEELIKLPRLEAELIKMSSTHDQERSKYVQIFQQQQEQINKHATVMSKVTYEKTALEQTIKALTQQVKTLKTSISTKRVHAAEEKMEKCQRLSTKTQDELTSLKKELQEAKQMLSQKSVTIENLQRKIQQLQQYPGGKLGSNSRPSHQAAADRSSSLSSDKVAEALRANPYLQDFYRDQEKAQKAAQEAAAAVASSEWSVASSSSSSMPRRPSTAGATRRGVRNIPSASELLADLNRTSQPAVQAAESSDSGVIVLQPGAPRGSIALTPQQEKAEKYKEEFEKELQAMDASRWTGTGTGQPSPHTRRTSITSILQGRLRPHGRASSTSGDNGQRSPTQGSKGSEEADDDAVEDTEERGRERSGSEPHRELTQQQKQQPKATGDIATSMAAQRSDGSNVAESPLRIIDRSVVRPAELLPSAGSSPGLSEAPQSALSSSLSSQHCVSAASSLKEQPLLAVMESRDKRSSSVSSSKSTQSLKQAGSPATQLTLQAGEHIERGLASPDEAHVFLTDSSTLANSSLLNGVTVPMLPSTAETQAEKQRIRKLALDQANRRTAW